MTTITLENAKQDLPNLLKRVLEGEQIMIAVDGKLVRLAEWPVVAGFNEAIARSRGYGAMKGEFEVTDAFFEPLPEEELKAWEGQDND